MDRSYTIAEIDALRSACENKWLWGSYSRLNAPGYGRSYREEVKMRCVEELVRTHMLAGHTAADLYASELPSTAGGES